MTSIWSGWGPEVTLALLPSSCPMGPEMSHYICQVSCCWQVDSSRLTCSPQRGLHALHFLLGLQQVHHRPVNISLKGRRLGGCETLLLPAGGGPRAQGLCTAFLLSLELLERWVWGGLCGPSSRPAHTVATRRAHQPHSAFRPASKGLFQVGEKSHRPRPPSAGQLLVFHRSPQLEPAQPFNIWLGKRKMNVPSIFPSPFPLLPRRP